ncbi:MAG: Mut7-C RNAse domain-containing protein [Candidatus Omnitrophica bacterium]|nr:Mut7-C RNAse domain-containing protein [Candidatus Omnitrophota bacterium]MCM8799134.1 Mut7-C RNAse domain-containing protein [Candidatus Omnitrophota bacterium]
MIKFILTKELGRLAKWLRILGFDTIYFKEENKGLLLLTSLREERIILTRNQRLAKIRGPRIINIKSDNLKGQLREVLELFKIDEEKMFSRCVICNLELDHIEKEKVKGKVPEYVFQTQNNFYTCKSCGRTYWQGTHWGNVTKILEEIGI